MIHVGCTEFVPCSMLLWNIPRSDGNRPMETTYFSGTDTEAKTACRPLRLQNLHACMPTQTSVTCTAEKCGGRQNTVTIIYFLHAGMFFLSPFLYSLTGIFYFCFKHCGGSAMCGIGDAGAFRFNKGNFGIYYASVTCTKRLISISYTKN